MWDYEKLGMENFNMYEKYTKDRDWEYICQLNGVDISDFSGINKELQVLPRYLEDGEVVLALTSGDPMQEDASKDSWGLSSWLIVLTTNRVLFLCCPMFGSTVKDRSFRHNTIRTIEAKPGLVFGKLTFDIAGNGQIIVRNCAKSSLKPIIDLSNKWWSIARKLAQQKNSELPNNVSTDSFSKKTEPNEKKVEDKNIVDELKKIADLKQAGVLSEEEFTAAKARLLSRL